MIHTDTYTHNPKTEDKNSMDHRLFIDTGTTRNPEQKEAQFYANIAPFLDLIFNRTPVKMPEIPEQFRAKQY